MTLKIVFVCLRLARILIGFLLISMCATNHTMPTNDTNSAPSQDETTPLIVNIHPELNQQSMCCCTSEAGRLKIIGSKTAQGIVSGAVAGAVTGAYIDAQFYSSNQHAVNEIGIYSGLGSIIGSMLGALIGFVCGRMAAENPHNPCGAIFCEKTSSIDKDKLQVVLNSNGDRQCMACYDNSNVLYGHCCMGAKKVVENTTLCGECIPKIQTGCLSCHESHEQKTKIRCICCYRSI